MTLTETREALQRMRNRFRAIKGDTEAITGRGIGAGVAFATGLGIGYLRADPEGVPKLPGTEIKLDDALTATATAVTVLGFAGKHTEVALAVTYACLGASGARMGEDARRSGRI